jgi:RimJ/RimL family protein N-acetyltransferase
MAECADIVLRTDRLLVRPALPDDVDFYLELWTDPRVMVNVGFPQGLRITRDDILEKIEKQRQKDTEFGRLLVVVLEQTGQVVGECKMDLPDEEGISRTDVKLLPVFWGHHYGVEVKRALVGHLFAHTDCTAVEGYPNVNNIASIKMQEAVGGVRIGEKVYEFPEEMRDYTTPVHHYIYRVERTGW